MRFIPSLFLLCLLFAGCALPAFAQDDIRLRFETIDPITKQPAGWEAGIGMGTSGILPGMRIAADSQTKQEGRYALSLSSSAGSDDFVSVVYVIRKRIRAKKIRLSGYLRTEGVKGSAGLWMRIDGRDKVVGFDNMGGRRVKGTTGWQRLEIDLPYDQEQAERISVGALLEGSGRIWIDHFRITAEGRELAQIPAYMPVLPPADKDTAYLHGSGIDSISLTPDKIRRLADLGALWGFIKYYHQGVQAGNHNMDAALFRFLPLILNARDDAQAHGYLERWVDMFGRPAPCDACADAGKIRDAALRPDYGPLFRKGYFPSSLTAKLEYIRANRHPGDARHYYIDMQAGIGNPIFRNDPTYRDQPYPDAGLRLLALYRYWSAINYFFPYRHLIGEDWNGVLPDAIPEFCRAADTTAYQVACLKLIGRINDSHGHLWSGSSKIQVLKGRFVLPVSARFIEDRLVVTGYYKDTPGIRQKLLPGDVIERIDGIPVAELLKRFLPLTPGSNREAQLRDLVSAGGHLLRSDDSAASLSIAGKGSDIRVTRIPADPGFRSQDLALFRPARGFQQLPGNIGYLYPALLGKGSLDSAYKSLQATKGLIIDLRCYPGTFMPFTYGAWLKGSESPFVRFTTGSTDIPGLFVLTPLLSNGGANRDHYKGKVVIIVNELTQSQAEYTTMALQTVPGAVTIGSTTAGADGNVSEILLPGGLRTMISGIGVLYPDGTETQRKGVKIDRIVRPTVSGIREGRDELLEAALGMIN